MSKVKEQKTDTRKNVRGVALDARIKIVLNNLLKDPEITPAQFTVSEVARRAGCSRETLHNKGIPDEIAMLVMQKTKQQTFSTKLARSRKPKVLILEDSNLRLRDELEASNARHDQVVSKLARVLNNIRRFASKLGVSAEQIMIEIENKPLESMSHRVVAFGKRK
jgi:predicted house-cleaning noncanonical NTP pyrophosphatase (MazG superfamily)